MMNRTIDRAALKTQGKAFVRAHFLHAFLVVLLGGVVGGFFNVEYRITDTVTETTRQTTGYEIIEHNGNYYRETVDGTKWQINVFKPFGTIAETVPVKILIEDMFIVEAPFAVYAAFTAFILLGSVLILNPLRVGSAGYFAEGIRGREDMSRVIKPFKDAWIPTAAKMLLLDVTIALWGLLLIIPGVIKNYQYYYVPYLLADHPQMTLREAKTLSRQMTEDKKFQIFVLELSFFLWILLCIVTAGIAFIYVAPYMSATFGALYVSENDLLDTEPDYAHSTYGAYRNDYDEDKHPWNETSQDAIDGVRDADDLNIQS
ncbi:DUF975 family protein [Peptoniphilus equinus]|uniref:DUF975 family protein n=1 Tax=Peptoniphilus equinus TaxID=3016343 RepID=A0ABY7QT76_9FIRM|nr:DUF975 family protein [Peptoniphilus equinus]WBW50002.1 DUF975 family protein [Peptoniphilus equinus]